MANIRIDNVRTPLCDLDEVVVCWRKNGIGDILVHRMIFEDMKQICPKVSFSCLPKFHDLVIDHPFIDQVIDLVPLAVNVYDTTDIADLFERSSYRHRSDVWAEFCGVKLKNHSMHIQLTSQELQRGHDLVQGRIVLSPYSVMPSKSLDAITVQKIVDELNVFVVHDQFDLRTFMGVIAAAKLVISVDTAAFHLAGGLGKKVIGIFSWTDGDIVGKYYNAKIIQKHRKNIENWCGPCWSLDRCPYSGERKPCITEITAEEIVATVWEI